MPSTTIAPQSRIGNFEITRVLELKELNCTLVEGRHLPTGAEVMHLACEDDENLFCLSFRTYPDKSDGVAHILEHTALCGSKKFPVKDPFFSMTRRSLNTFMNALTGADFTCYPASSCIPKDFYNLLEVYLDAVFHPKLNKLSFLQEGHRLEFTEPENPDSPLCFKGIVFNEMKGALHNSDTRLIEALMKSLFPDLTYGVNSGGDPKEIMDLTYEKLKEFHKTFYQPSRCLFFFYGNIPLEKHLAFIEEKALKEAKKVAPLPYLPKQPRYTKPLRKVEHYPISEGESEKDKTIVALGWLTCSILDQLDLLALAVIDIVLMGTDGSRLKNAILRSGLCKAADTMLEAEISEVPYAFIFRGCHEQKGEHIEKFLFEELRKIEKEGFSPHLIDGAIHQLEFSRSEITGNSSPFGLSLFMRSALLKQHGGKPEDGLLIHSLFNSLRENCKNLAYLPGILRKYALDNPHFVRIDLVPSKVLAKEELEEEKEKLAKIQVALSPEQKKAIIKEAKELALLQEEDEGDTDVLPKLDIEDVPKKAKEIPLLEENVGNVKVFRHSCFTNGIVYATLALDLPYIKEEEFPYLRLFTTFLTHMGAGGRTYIETLEEQLVHTGGIDCSLDLCLQADNPNEMRPCIFLSGKALHRKVDRLFPLMKDYIEWANFKDPQRLKELLMQHFHGLEESAHRGSLRYAVNLAAAGLSLPGKITNTWYGLDYYYAIKKIVAAFETNPESLIEKLEDLQERCLTMQGAHLVLSCDEEIYGTLKKEGFYGLSGIPLKPFTPWSGNYPLVPTPSQGRITASPVAFTAWLFPAPHYLHPDAPALYVVSEILENTTLHKRIREQGGAYGSGAVNSSMGGSFYFYAYRDPHLASTLEAIEESVNDLIAGEFDEKDIEEAKLGVFQELDSPIPPKGRAITAYARWRSKRTHAARQAFRDKLFSLSKEDLIKAAEKHLRTGLKKGVVITFAGKELLEKENKRLKLGPLPLYPIEA